MSDFRKLSDGFYASPQIAAGDVATAAANGITLIVNNRPDGEAPDQPAGAEIESAAREAGLAYIAIPVSGGFDAAQIDALREAVTASSGPVLGFCRSGTRSTLLWSLLQASEGGDPEAIAAAARNAGYDVAPIRPAMDALVAQAKG